MKEKLEIEYVLINEIRPNEYNPKKMSEEAEKELEKSIVEFGIVDPIIANKAIGREGIIIGGHQRYKIYKKLNYEKVPVIWLDIPDLEREKELCLRLSKNTGDWDFDLLANFSEDLLKDVGFEEELDNIFGTEVDEAYDAEKEFNKVVKNPKGVKTGDLWKLGEHKLYVGDSGDKTSWANLLGEERFDFMFTDPPYRIGYGVGVRKQKTNRDGTPFKEGEMVQYFGTDGNRGYLGVDRKGGVIEYDSWLSIANGYQNSKGVNVMIFENWKNTVDLWQAIEKYWKIKNQIIWWLPNRNQGFSAKHRFFSKYDIAPLAGEGEVNEQYEQELEEYIQTKGQKLLDTYEVILYGNKGGSYWDKKKGTRWATVNDHITWTAGTQASHGDNVVFGTKPIQVLVPYVKILSPRDGIVMEPFGGSGSTLIACEIMKRKARCIEIEPMYAEVIINRWEKFTNQKATKL